MAKSILFIVDEFYPIRSAPSIRISSFIRELQEHKITLLGGWSKKGSTQDFSTIRLARPNEKNFISFAWFLFKMNWKMRSLQKKYDVIVLSIPKYELLFFFRSLKKKCNRLILDVRDSINFINYESYFSHFLPSKIASFFGKKVKKIMHSIFFKSLKVADLVTVANEGILGTIKKFKKNVVVVSNGVDTDSFIPHNKNFFGTLNVVYIGNFAEKDSFDLVYNSLKNLKNVTLHLVGNGRDKAKVLKNLAKNSIDFVDHGFVDHTKLPTILNSMHVGFIFRNQQVNESIPVALFEFCSMNIVSVVNNVGMMAKFVRQHDLGFVVDCDSEFRDLLVKIGQDRSILQQYSSLHKLACENFSRKSQAIKFKKTIFS